MAKEINLVPDIKNEFIKTLKFRNFVFFLCMVVASASLLVILIFLSIAGGQQGFINAKQTTIDLLESKISEYGDLSDFLTIRDQLSNINSITENKTIMSRTFNVLSALIPRGADYVNVSELTVNLANADGTATFAFDAQANAGTEPFIDYKVLDSFKKSMMYMRYDYGEYVDKEGQTIPAYCIIEKDNDGATLKDPNNGYYAFWLIQGDGCNPSAEQEQEEDNDSQLFSDNQLDNNPLENQPQIEPTEAHEPTVEELSASTGYQIEEYNGQKVVRIWRTPQYSEWYKTNSKENEPVMDLDGNIAHVAHFESACIKYSGTQRDDKSITWSATNDSCFLVPSSEDGSTGIKIQDSSNGRDSNNELVLRFSATITLAPEVFNFNNHHMLALPPSSHYNVTDSYSQIQTIFAERASDCDQNDTACITTPTGDNTETENNEGDAE